MTGKNGLDMLKGVTGVKKEPDEQKNIKELEKLRKDYKISDAKAINLIAAMGVAVDDIDNGNFDYGQRERIADINDDHFNSLIEEDLKSIDDKIVECSNSEDYALLLKEQNNIIQKMQEDFDEVTAIVGIDGNELLKKTKVQKDTKNDIDTAVSKPEPNKEEILNVLEKYDATIALAEKDYPKNKKIKNILGQVVKKVRSDRGVLKMTNIKRRKEKVKELRNYVSTVTDQIETEMSRVDVFVALIREFGRTGTVYQEVGGENRRFQIISYDVSAGDQIKYTENKTEHTESADTFRKIIADTKKKDEFVKLDETEYNQLVDRVRQEYEKNKNLQDLVNAIDRTVKRKKTKLNKIKGNQRKKDFVGELQKYLVTVTGQIKERVELEEQKNQKNIVTKSNKKDTKEPGEAVGIADDIGRLFGTSEIRQYIGEGKSKKIQDNEERIKGYKEEIVESIMEIERASGRVINRDQFALDCVAEKGAPKMSESLEKSLLELHRQDDIQKTRDASDITFAQMKKRGTEYKGLNADTVEQGDEKFKQVTREVWKEFAVRGFLRKNRETGEMEVKPGKTNTDGRIAMMLLQQAGMNIKNTKYLAPGDYEPGRINIDLGDEDGIVILADGTVIIDHHADDSPLDTSATENVYDILIRLGMLEKTDGLDRLVAFVNDVDNFDYPDANNYFKNYFKNSWETILGVYKMMDAKKLREFFEYKDDESGKPLSPTQPLEESFLEEFGIENEQSVEKKSKGQNAKEKTKREYEALQEMEKNGFIIESDRYGKICVDVNQFASNDSARAFGCSTYVLWNQTQNNVFMSSLVGKAIEDKFEQGKNIRKTMWIKSASKNEKLTMQLKDVLEKMTDGKLKPSEELQKSLDNNGERTDCVVLSEKEMQKLGAYIDYTKKTLKFIKEMNLADFGITNARVASKRKRKLVKVAWKELEKNIHDGARFTSAQVEEIVTLIKDKI